MKKTYSFLCLTALATTLASAQINNVDSLGKLFQLDDHRCCFSQMNSPHPIVSQNTYDIASLKKGKKNASQAKNVGTGSATPHKPLYNDKDAMIKVSSEDDKWYFEIADTILGREILAVSRFTSTPAELGIYGGEQYRYNTIYFEKNDINKTIILKTRKTYMTADTLDAVYKAVKASSNDPIVAVFKLEKSKKGSCKIDVTEFLMSENILCITPNIKKEINASNLNKQLSYVESIHSYPINTEIRSLRTYNISSSSYMHPTMTFGLNTSLYLLPKIPMQPRIFDPRVGFFTDGHYKYSDNQQQVERCTFVTRRRLEPKNAEDAARQRNGELIEPKQQIVYYIDPATPKQWRPYLIAGVNDWNEAFEQAGWKNAITALEWPENDSTMSMEDSRYSVIMYLASDIANAYGPQNHDPRSGEIIESHVGWYHNVMSLVHNWYQIQCGALDPEARNAKFSDELMGELIRFVSSHEIGHTLGLRHNFGASATVPTDSLRSNGYLTENGFCPSIMDYARFNYVAQPQDGVEVKNLFPRINQYDKWAIEWAYKPIYEATDAESDRYILNKITTQKTNLDKRYIWFDGEGLSIDPRRQTEDLGDDAVKSSNLGIENLKRIAPYLREWNYWGNDNNDKRTSEMYNQLIGQFKRYCYHVARNLSGVNHTPLAPEQKGVVFQYPPKEKAASVVAFFEKQVIEEPRWLVDVPYFNRVSISKDDFLENVCGPIVQSITMGGMIAGVNPNYGSQQYLSDLTKAFFKDFNTSAPLSRYQRYMQSIFVNNLCASYKASRNGIANEALAAIYTTLKDMEKKFEKTSSTDKLTESHYTQLYLSIKQALAVNQ